MKQRPAPAEKSVGRNLFSALVGAFLAVALVKFGNPVIMEDKVTAPADFWEALYQPWPVRWGYWFLGLLLLLTLGVGRWKRETPKWVLILPALWVGWQFVSATHTVNVTVTSYTVPHFVACVVCFFIGWFALAEDDDARFFWILIAMGFLWSIRVGFEQHFGGLEQTRAYFYAYILPELKEPPTDYLKKISSNRIFSTLFYPNSFAAAILLLLPSCIVTAFLFAVKFGRKVQLFVIFGLGAAALACLYWSGSKAGWLLMLLVAVAALWHAPIPRKVKIGVVVGLCMIGLTAFFVRYAGFFQKGATSMVARTDYWRAAIHVFQAYPIFGSGPGTFSTEYARIKSPESEMARLAHNDYLEQASDSGLIGFLTFLAFISGSLLFLYRYRQRWLAIHLATWIGLVGICFHGIVEFNLYIPALAWPTFLLLGWLWGVAKPMDNAPRTDNLAHK